MLLRAELLIEPSQDLLRVSDYVMVGADVLVDLGPVDVYVHYLRLAREGFRVESDAVGETAAYRYEQVALADSYVRSLGAFLSSPSYVGRGRAFLRLP